MLSLVIHATPLYMIFIFIIMLCYVCISLVQHILMRVLEKIKAFFFSDEMIVL